MPDTINNVATERDDPAVELERLRTEVMKIEADHDSSIEELLQLMRRKRSIAWSAIGALGAKGAIGLALWSPASGEWWLNASSVAVGAGLAGLLIAPNARKLVAELSTMGSLTAKFRTHRYGRG